MNHDSGAAAGNNARGPEAEPPPLLALPAFPKGALGAWWRQGARTALFMRPQWQGLQATPTMIAGLILVLFLFGMLVQRLTIAGPAYFYPPALQSGWLWSVVAAWVCWLLVPRAHVAGAATDCAPSAAALFALLAAQAFMLDLMLALPLLAMARNSASADMLGAVGAWVAWGLPVTWVAAAQLVLAWRSSAARPLPRSIALLPLAAALLLGQWMQPLQFWYPDTATDSAQGPPPLQLTQPLLEAQAKTLANALAAVAPARAGAIDVYTITFAPYADEDVFLRESRMVADVMAQRFGSAGRTVQLANHRDTMQLLPWATPLNLQRTIARMAQRMDRDKDVLFIHLTSHGARSGQLSAAFWPLAVEALTPQTLKAWLDEAGIRHRVVSVSACYSGSWIAPLADANTLVMTAADADHTSYGCGRKSPLTYFGRAMFDEQMRQTWSFEDAHAEARRVIDRREKEAGKNDGFSNPQISVGAAMHAHLARLAAQRLAAQPGP